MYRFWARWLILIGICLTTLGVLFNFQLERHSLRAGTDWEFALLEYAFLPVLLVGLLATLVGSVICAWRQTSVSRLGSSGLVIATVTLLAAKLIPFNIHGWTGSLMFVFVVSLSIGLIFLLFAAVRFTSSRLALRRR